MITYIPAPPTVLDDISWLVRLVADTAVATFRALLRAFGLLPPEHHGAHYLRTVGLLDAPARPESGVDEEYATELHDTGAQMVEDREFGLYSGVDLVADAGTGQFKAVDYRDAWPTGYLADPVDLAFAGGVR